MSSVFDSYERQYCELSAHLSQALSSIASLSPDEYQARLKEVEAGMLEAESLTKRMDLEARSLPPPQRSSLLSKIRELKSDLAGLKRDFKACPATPQSASLSGAAKGSSGVSSEQRLELLQGNVDSSSRGAGQEYEMHETSRGAKMLSATARMEQTSERLQNSRRVLVETEDLGVSILEDLNAQRQTLLHARETLYGVDDSIARARQVLSNMAKHATRHKLVAAGIGIFLILAIMAVIYLKVKG